MDLPTVQHQEIGAHSVENMMVCPNSKTSQDQIRKPRPQPEQALKCPRCDSTNTKFCYYNNYSLSQPRYFCKSCRRYWTQGGTLRNVPVGGGCRKNKRSSSTNSSSSSSSKKPQDHPFASAAVAGHLSYDHQANDLSLAFARLHKNSCGSGSGSGIGPTFNDFDFSVLGMANGDVLNGFAYNSQGMYYDDNDNNMGGIESGGDQMRLQPFDQDHHQYTNATTTAVTVTTMKQELFGGREINNAADGSKILWGYPNWQINGNNNHNNINNGITDSNMMMAMDLDSGSARESWNNAFNNASSWHGLLNSPLM